MASPRNTALIIIDAQKAFLEWEASGLKRNNPNAVSQMKQLLDVFRDNDWPLFHIRHSSVEANSKLAPQSPGYLPIDELAELEGETVLVKKVNSSFIGTDLEKTLREMGIETLVITGITTNHCCETTARMGGNLGFDVRFISDATYTFDRSGPSGKLHSAEDIHQMTLSNLHGEFAAVETTQEIKSSLMGTLEEVI